MSLPRCTTAAASHHRCHLSSRIVTLPPLSPLPPPPAVAGLEADASVGVSVSGCAVVESNGAAVCRVASHCRRHHCHRRHHCQYRCERSKLMLPSVFAVGICRVASHCRRHHTAAAASPALEADASVGVSVSGCAVVESNAAAACRVASHCRRHHCHHHCRHRRQLSKLMLRSTPVSLAMLTCTTAATCRVVSPRCHHRCHCRRLQ